MIDTAVLAGILDRHDVLHVFHHTYCRMVTACGAAYRTSLRIRYIVAHAAIDHLFFETDKSIGERLNLFAGLAKQMKHQTQCGSAPHPRKRSHLVYSLL